MSLRHLHSLNVYCGYGTVLDTLVYYAWLCHLSFTFLWEFFPIFFLVMFCYLLILHSMSFSLIIILHLQYVENKEKTLVRKQFCLELDVMNFCDVDLLCFMFLFLGRERRGFIISFPIHSIDIYVTLIVLICQILALLHRDLSYLA